MPDQGACCFNGKPLHCNFVNGCAARINYRVSVPLELWQLAGISSGVDAEKTGLGRSHVFTSDKVEYGRLGQESDPSGLFLNV